MTKWITADQALQLAYGNNPLLEALGPHMDTKVLAKRIWQMPLESIPWQQVRPKEREALLEEIENHFVATPIALDAAQSFQMLLRQHYLRRNPLHQRTRAQLNTLAAAQGERIQALPWFNGGARAMALRGITGMGKSVTMERILSLYPQTVLHDACPAAGWLQMRQLLYLQVQMSGDTSRAGFLTQILAAVDAVLGTDYYAQYAGKQGWTVEKLMVVVGIILSRHYCGALIIEELQARNFSEIGSRNLLLLFFLRLMNFGIPIVLVGNPLGFHEFDSFSQDVRRLYSSGCFDFWPSDSVDDAGWDQIYLPGLAQFHLLDKPFTWTPSMMASAKRGSGGVPDFMTHLWKACQRNALMAGADAITEVDIDLAANDAVLVPQRRLIHALRDQDVELLAECEDVPWEDFERRWPEPEPADGDGNDPSGEAGSAQPSPQAPVEGVTAKFLKGERAFNARTAREQKAAAKPKANHATDDLRNDETCAALLQGLAAMQDAAPTCEKSAAEPKAA